MVRRLWSLVEGYSSSPHLRLSSLENWPLQENIQEILETLLHQYTLNYLSLAHACTQTHKHTHTSIHAHTCAHTYTDRHIPTHGAHTQTHTRTHTHTHTRDSHTYTRGPRVYPYSRVYSYSTRTHRSGTGRLGVSRVGSRTGKVITGTGVPGFTRTNP